MEDHAPPTGPRRLARDRVAEVVRAALEIHRSLGPGLAPTLYQRALRIELDERGLRSVRGVRVDLTYKGHPLGRSWVALIADGVLVGVRAAPLLTPGDVTLMTLQARSLKAEGVLVNFGGEHLELRRIRSANPAAPTRPSPH